MRALPFDTGQSSATWLDVIFRGATDAPLPVQAREGMMTLFARVCRPVWDLSPGQCRNHWRNDRAGTGDNLQDVIQAREGKHSAHGAAMDITRRNGSIVVERLRTKNMRRSSNGPIEAPGTRVARKRRLNRAILNVGWRRIQAMLACKAARFVSADPSYISRTCASCGTVDGRSHESQAVIVCTACGYRDHADRNAAVNILDRGNSPGVEPRRRADDDARAVQAARASWKSPAIWAGKML
ncbi:MAG: transposase [Paracoccaceae bacterium]|nr:transposase [Paracoccaceae bacterium]